MNIGAPSYIYVIGVTGMQAVKIGSTADYKTRLGELQVGCPMPLSLLWLRATANAHAGEKALHRHFAEWRTRGEWFNLGPDPIPLIEEACRTILPGVDLQREMNRKVLQGQVVPDILMILDSKFQEKDFIEGLLLAEELRQLDDRSYSERTALSVAQLVSKSLLPVRAKQVRLGKKVVRVYFTKDIRKHWGNVMPLAA